LEKDHFLKLISTADEKKNRPALMLGDFILIRSMPNSIPGRVRNTFPG